MNRDKCLVDSRTHLLYVKGKYLQIIKIRISDVKNYFVQSHEP